MPDTPKENPEPGPPATTPAPTPAPALIQRLRTGALSTRKPTRFALAPDAATRAALARELGLLALDVMSFKGEIRPSGARDFVLEARITATVVQPCGVTLAPVITHIDEAVTRRYLADWVEPEGDEIEMPEDDTIDPLPEVIDLGGVATEALSLALPLYPRAPGVAWDPVAVAPDGVRPLTDDDLKPFAGLAALKDRLDGGPE